MPGKGSGPMPGKGSGPTASNTTDAGSTLITTISANGDAVIAATG